MKELLRQVFIESLCKKTALSVEKLHAFSYTVLAEKPDRSHSQEVTSPHPLSSKLLNDFFCLPFPSVVSDLSLLCRQKSCTFATTILGLFEHHVKIWAVSWQLPTWFSRVRGPEKLLPAATQKILQ